MNRQLASSFVVTVVASLGVASIGGGCGSPKVTYDLDRYAQNGLPARIDRKSVV